MNIILLGAPASGKGTQSENIIKEFNFFHLSTGDIIRTNIDNQTEYGIKCKKYVQNGKLVPYSLLIDMINDFLRNNKKNKNIIWDGFPRTIEQAISLDEILKKNQQQVDIVFYLNVNEHVALDRIINRVVCPKCKSSYNLKHNIPKNPNFCDFDNHHLIKRSDDDVSKFKTRLVDYNTLTKKLLSYYKKKIIKIDSNVDNEIIWKIIRDAINDYN